MRLVKVLQKAPRAVKDWNSSISFDYEGSILSILKEDRLPPSILAAKRFFEDTESLDMLTPERLRQRTRTAEGSLRRSKSVGVSV